MGATNATCMSVAKTTSSSLGNKQNTSKAPVKKEVQSFEGWVGEWTYIVRNEVHSFDLMVEDGKLIYLENMGMTTMKGQVFLQKGGKTAKIVAKKMNFEIFLDRVKMIARYRTLGAKKWTKEIQVLKVNEIDDSGQEPSCDSLGTLKNTWRNQSMHDSPTNESGCLVRDGSARGCSLRRAQSLKFVAHQSENSSTDIQELYKRNTSKRSIRFQDEVVQELKAELRKYEAGL